MNQRVSKQDRLTNYNHVLGLADINRSIAAQEIFVVMGLSSSGKSALIRHVNRLLDPTEGVILIDGQRYHGVVMQRTGSLRTTHRARMRPIEDVMHPIIALWTHPRSRSTAFERVIMERGDLVILHEPFSYLYYVHEEQATISQEYVDPHHPRTYLDIRAHILALANQSPVFFKDMCSHCFADLRQDDAFLQRLTNTFLVREPSHAIASFYTLNPHVRSDEIGYEPLFDIFDHVARLTRRVPVVMNADDLVENPHRLIEAYCSAVGLVFIPEALHWDVGHKPAWDIWKQ